MNPLLRRLTGASLCAALLITSAAHAQSYPSKPIVFVSTFPPGGGSDIVTRLLAAKLATNLGQQVPVDNRAGATGTIGAASVARAAPDGYTMMFGTAAALAVAPALYGNLSFDPVKSFAPVIEVARGYFVLLVNPSLPVKTPPNSSIMRNAIRASSTSAPRDRARCITSAARCSSWLPASTWSTFPSRAPGPRCPRSPRVTYK